MLKAVLSSRDVGSSWLLFPFPEESELAPSTWQLLCRFNAWEKTIRERHAFHVDVDTIGTVRAHTAVSTAPPALLRPASTIMHKLICVMLSCHVFFSVVERQALPKACLEACPDAHGAHLDR